MPSITHLAKLVRYEKPSFTLKLLKNSTIFAVNKYIFQRSIMTKRIHGSIMQFDLTDAGICRSLLLTGDREREHRYLLRKIIKPNMDILDLGANIGYYVLMEHQLLKGTGQVIAIEPSPINFKLLEKNVSLNDLENRTKIVHAAVANHDGTAILHLSRFSNVHSLIASQTHQPTGQSLTIPAISISTINQQYPNISLIRMDIEGYELTLLESLVKLNQSTSWLPKILFELHPPKYDIDRFNRLLKDLFDLGYQAAYLATSHRDLLTKHQVVIEARITTDGTVRYIGRNIELEALQTLAPYSRALLLVSDN